MKLRLHFAVGSTAMAKIVEFSDATSLSSFSDELWRNRRDDTVITFLNASHAGNSFAVAARSIILLEEL